MLLGYHWLAHHLINNKIALIQCSMHFEMIHCEFWVNLWMEIPIKLLCTQRTLESVQFSEWMESRCSTLRTHRIGGDGKSLAEFRIAYKSEDDRFVESVSALECNSQLNKCWVIRKLYFSSDFGIKMDKFVGILWLFCAISVSFRNIDIQFEGTSSRLKLFSFV